jgi:hypothetical protein
VCRVRAWCVSVCCVWCVCSVCCVRVRKRVCCVSVCMCFLRQCCGMSLRFVGVFRECGG